MNTCDSYKNKNSTEKCNLKRLRGLHLCGKHARSKSLRLWNPTVSYIKNIIKIQAWWRLISIKQCLKLAGETVLKRAKCHNDEDIVTTVSKEKQHPLDYFSFEDNGKIFWFDVYTLFKWMCRSVNPLNPYTNQPLTIETRMRIREIINKKLIKPDAINHELFSGLDLLNARINQLCQIFEEYGYKGVTRDTFLRLNITQIYLLYAISVDEVHSWSLKRPQSILRRAAFHLLRQRASLIFGITQDYLTAFCRTFLAIFRRLKRPHAVCKILYSALMIM